MIAIVTLVFVAAAPFQAGAAAVDITPKHFPISVNGGFTDRTATKANDPLHARAVVLDDGTTRLALVTVDSCLILRAVLDAAKAKAAAKTGIPAGNMMISATHTHTAPTVTPAFGSEPDPKYVAFLTEKIAESIIAADAAKVPATVGIAVWGEPRPLFNRRFKIKTGETFEDPFGGSTDRVKMNPGFNNPKVGEPAGPVDPEVTVLAVRTVAGKPLAAYCVYGLHYVGDLPPLSADYFGVFCSVLGPKVGAADGFVAALANGTSGDVNNVDTKAAAMKTEPGEKCRAVAEMVAAAAAKAFNFGWPGSMVLGAANAEVKLGVRKPDAARLERAKKIVAAAKTRRTAAEVYAWETLKLAEYPDTVTVPLQVLRIGDFAFCGVPCEVFAEIGLAVKAKHPRAQVVSLANGYFGYLPTAEQHALGGYETWAARSSYLEVGAAAKIEAGLFELLK